MNHLSSWHSPLHKVNLGFAQCKHSGGDSPSIFSSTVFLQNMNLCNLVSLRNLHILKNSDILWSCCRHSVYQRTNVNSPHLNLHCLQLGLMPVSPEGLVCPNRRLLITDDTPTEEERPAWGLWCDWDRMLVDVMDLRLGQSGSTLTLLPENCKGLLIAWCTGFESSKLHLH